MKKLRSIILILMFLPATSTVAHSLTVVHSHNKSNVQAEEGIKIKMTLGNKTYDLQSYSLNFYRPEKTPAETPSSIYGNLSSTITISIRSSKIDQELLDWMLAPEAIGKDGQIVVSDAESGKVLRTVTFTGVKTANYNENIMTNNYGINNLQNTNFSLRYKTINVKF